jgi:hypothetical protein
MEVVGMLTSQTKILEDAARLTGQCNHEMLG